MRAGSGGGAASTQQTRRATSRGRKHGSRQKLVVNQRNAPLLTDLLEKQSKIFVIELRKGDPTPRHRLMRRVDLLAETRHAEHDARRADHVLHREGGVPGAERRPRTAARQRTLGRLPIGTWYPPGGGSAAAGGGRGAWHRDDPGALAGKGASGSEASRQAFPPPVHARDLRIIDPVFAQSQEPAILTRREALVVNLPPIRAIITRSKCLLVPQEGFDEELRVVVDRIRMSSEASSQQPAAATANTAAAQESQASVAPGAPPVAAASVGQDERPSAHTAVPETIREGENDDEDDDDDEDHSPSPATNDSPSAVPPAATVAATPSGGVGGVSAPAERRDSAGDVRLVSTEGGDAGDRKQGEGGRAVRAPSDGMGGRAVRAPSDGMGGFSSLRKAVSARLANLIPALGPRPSTGAAADGTTTPSRRGRMHSAPSEEDLSEGDDDHHHHRHQPEDGDDHELNNGEDQPQDEERSSSPVAAHPPDSATRRRQQSSASGAAGAISPTSLAVVVNVAAAALVDDTHAASSDDASGVGRGASDDVSPHDSPTSDGSRSPQHRVDPRLIASPTGSMLRRVQRLGDASENADPSLAANGGDGRDGTSASKGSMLPWELQVLEALLLVVTSRLRLDVKKLEPRTRRVVAAFSGQPIPSLRSSADSRRSEDDLRPCCGCRSRRRGRGAEADETSCCSLRCCACRCSQEPSQTAMLAEMGGLRRDLESVQAKGRALSHCLEELLESPLALARLDLTACAAQRDKERARQARATMMMGGPMMEPVWNVPLDAGPDVMATHVFSQRPVAAAARGPSDDGTATPLRSGAVASNTSPRLIGGPLAGSGASGVSWVMDPSGQWWPIVLPGVGGAAGPLPATPHGLARADSADEKALVGVGSTDLRRRRSASDGSDTSTDSDDSASETDASIVQPPSRQPETDELPAADAPEAVVPIVSDAEDPDFEFYGDAPELLIESYLGQVGSALAETRRLESNAETAERQLTLSLAASRNMLLRVDISVAVCTLCLALMSAVSGFFGMNVPNGLEESDLGVGQPWFIIVLSSSLTAVAVGLIMIIAFDRFISGSG